MTSKIIRKAFLLFVTLEFSINSFEHHVGFPSIEFSSASSLDSSTNNDASTLAAAYSRSRTQMTSIFCINSRLISTSKHMLLMLLPPLYWWASRRVNKSSYFCIIIRMLKPLLNGWVFIHQIPHAHLSNERRLIETPRRLCCKILFFFLDDFHLLLMSLDRLLLYCWPGFLLLLHSLILILNLNSQFFCSVGLSAVSLLTSMLIANLPVWWFNGQRRHDLAFFSTANIFHEFEPRGFRDKHKPMHKLCRRLSAQLHLLNANRVQVQTHNLSCYRPHETLINLNILFAWKLRPISENLSLHVA